MPAPAQGVLAVECRADDPVTAAQLKTLDHPPTRAAATAERRFLAALGAGCTTPAGALAELAAESGTEPAVRLSGPGDSGPTAIPCDALDALCSLRIRKTATDR